MDRATTALTDFPTHIAEAEGLDATNPKVRRITTLRAAHGIEVIAHAIEYLSDGNLAVGLSEAELRGRLKAIEVLMARNSELYLSCPVVPSLGELCRQLVALTIGRLSPSRKLRIQSDCRQLLHR